MNLTRCFHKHDPAKCFRFAVEIFSVSTAREFQSLKTGLDLHSGHLLTNVSNRQGEYKNEMELSALEAEALALLRF